MYHSYKTTPLMMFFHRIVLTDESILKQIAILLFCVAAKLCLWNTPLCRLRWNANCLQPNTLATWYSNGLLSVSNSQKYEEVRTTSNALDKYTFLFNAVYYIQWVWTVFTNDQHYTINGLLSTNNVLLMTVQLMVLMVLLLTHDYT